ncbi:MAG: MBL fold metallo-hydrolase [Halobacteriovoraceae bacterium]|nr:MBL fold metallo-hydrolase [Halobacteriovoraceae bacterium]
MADLKKTREQNKEGAFFVDSSCIDCGTCYWMAPDTFVNKDGQSAVFQQPSSLNEATSALRALYSCPTFSIGHKDKSPLDKEVEASFPFPIGDPKDFIYLTGFHAENSFGATSYFIERKGPEGPKNILVDSPRFFSKMAKKLYDRGGALYQFLTHRDDIADTDRYFKAFSPLGKTKRIIHQDDATKDPLKSYEIILKGFEPYQLDSETVIIPVPGHTRGSCVLLYKNKYLFTGDHLAYSLKLKQLIAFKRACWYDFNIQIESMKKLLDFSFSYILPGHGAPFGTTQEKMKKELEKCIQWMESS